MTTTTNTTDRIEAALITAAQEAGLSRSSLDPSRQTRRSLARLLEVQGEGLEDADVAVIPAAFWTDCAILNDFSI